MGAFCRWHEKEMRDLTEHEQQQCEESGQHCDQCPDLVDRAEDSGGRMTLQEFEAAGGCEGCMFYVEVEAKRKECTFRWFDDDSEDWEYSRNCNTPEVK